MSDCEAGCEAMGLSHMGCFDPTPPVISTEAARELLAAARAALAYDDAIKSCANDPNMMASFCTAQGDSLDTLYFDWLSKSRAAIAKVEGK